MLLVKSSCNLKRVNSPSLLQLPAWEEGDRIVRWEGLGSLLYLSGRLLVSFVQRETLPGVEQCTPLSSRVRTTVDWRGWGVVQMEPRPPPTTTATKVLEQQWP